MDIIGITGGIGTGKSLVSRIAAENGIRIIDADKIAHDITEKGSPVLEKLADAFGSDIIDEDGTLRRSLLADRAFASEESKELLDSLTHGEIKSAVAAQTEEARSCGEEAVIIDAPLLIESGLSEMCDYVWVVTADSETRIKRVMKRDGLTREQVIARMERQLSDDERNAAADFIIENSGTKEDLRVIIEELIGDYV